MKLLVKSGPEESFPLWKACFEKADPSLSVHFWSDTSIASDEVGYVMVWEPPKGWLATFPNLEIVFSSGAGVDHITSDPDWPSQLPLVRMGGTEMAQRMAEYIVWSALSLLRETRDFALGQAAREWRYKEVARNATEVKVGIMGLGNLGVASGAMLRAVGFQTLGWSRTRKTITGMECFAGENEFETFLSQSDILVCLLPATSETRGILNARSLACLPKGAGLISAGRGQHVIELDLIAALDTSHLQGAVLDVFETEPLDPASALWAHPAITITPHIASTPSRQDKANYVAQSIARFKENKSLQNVFVPDRGY